MAAAPAPYRLDELGWLQFERLSELVLEQEAGLSAIDVERVLSDL